MSDFIKEFIGEIVTYFYAVILLLFRLPEWIAQSWTKRSCKANSQTCLLPPDVMADQSLGVRRFVKIKRNKFHFVEAGSRQSPKLVLCLHDFADFWFGFRHQLRDLSKECFVLALDLKGFGDSDKPPDVSEYDMSLIVEELRTFLLLQDHHSGKVSLVGHGLGGLISWHFMDRYPEMVENLVSISTPHPKDFREAVNKNWASVKRNSLLFLSRLPFFSEHHMARNADRLFQDRKRDLLLASSSSQGSNVGTSWLFSDKDCEAYNYSFSRKADWRGPLNYFRNLPLHPFQSLRMRTSTTKSTRKTKQRKPSSSTSSSSADSVGLIEVRTLFIVGGRDKEVSLETICHSSEFVRKFAIKVIPNAGHFPHQEQPEFVNRFILDFICDDPPVSADVESSSTSKDRLSQAGNLIGSLYRQSVNGVSNTMGRVSTSVSGKVAETVGSTLMHPMVTNSPSLIMRGALNSTRPLVSGLSKSFSLEVLSNADQNDWRFS